MATAFPETTSMTDPRAMSASAYFEIKKKIPSVTYYQEGIFISRWDRGGPI